jgi:hypothetical protein
MKRHITCFFLAVSMLASMLFAVPVNARIYIPDINDPSVFTEQSQDGRCTLAAAVMMARRWQILDGNPDWADITESSMLSAAWVAGAGLRHDFTYRKMNFRRGVFSGGAAQKKEKLISLLETNPEGIVIWEPYIPHAVLLTGYDTDTDTFYCADPSQARTRAETKLTDAVMRGGAQDDRIGSLAVYWSITNRPAGEPPPFLPPPDNLRLDIFPDIFTDGQYYDAVIFVYERGLMRGMDTGDFAPYETLTREQAVTIIARLSGEDYLEYAGQSSFDDVAADRWSAAAVEWARTAGVTQGVGDNMFAPAGIVTYDQFEVMLMRHFNLREQWHGQSWECTRAGAASLLYAYISAFDC